MGFSTSCAASWAACAGSTATGWDWSPILSLGSPLRFRWSSSPPRAWLPPHSTDELARFRKAVLQTSGLLLVVGVAIVGATAVAGPQAMQLYGSGFDTGRGELVLLAAGVAFYLIAATCSQALLSVDAAMSAAGAWIVSAVAFIVVYAVASGAQLERVSIAFAIAPLAPVTALGGLIFFRIRRR